MKVKPRVGEQSHGEKGAIRMRSAGTSGLPHTAWLKCSPFAAHWATWPQLQVLPWRAWCWGQIVTTLSPLLCGQQNCGTC